MSQTSTRTSAADRREARAAAAAPDASGVFTHRQIITILVGLMLGMFLAALDQTVVSTAIRTIADDLHGYDLQAWATTAFLITSTIATPLYGKLSDLYGRRPFYLFAIGTFVLGSMLCVLATSLYLLAGLRACEGFGSGVFTHRQILTILKILRESWMEAVS
jgi:MFS family permease